MFLTKFSETCDGGSPGPSGASSLSCLRWLMNISISFWLKSPIISLYNLSLSCSALSVVFDLCLIYGDSRSRVPPMYYGAVVWPWQHSSLILLLLALKIEEQALLDLCSILVVPYWFDSLPSCSLLRSLRDCFDSMLRYNLYFIIFGLKQL